MADLCRDLPQQTPNICSVRPLKRADFLRFISSHTEHLLVLVKRWLIFHIFNFLFPGFLLVCSLIS